MRSRNIGPRQTIGAGYRSVTVKLREKAVDLTSRDKCPPSQNENISGEICSCRIQIVQHLHFVVSQVRREFAARAGISIVRENSAELMASRCSRTLPGRRSVGAPHGTQAGAYRVPGVWRSQAT